MSIDLGCEKRPEGTHEQCRACGVARLRRRLLAEDSRSDQHDRALRRDRKVRTAPVREVNDEHQRAVALASAIQLVLDVRDPKAIGLLRVEIEHGSVVVELHCHAPESIGHGDSLRDAVSRASAEGVVAS